MSYYWGLPGPIPPPSVCFMLENHSSLHQERAYLLSALASEEARTEQLTRSLNNTWKKLKSAERSEDSENDASNLRKAAAGLSRKIKASQRSQKAMINNLAAVTSRMQMLAEHKWRKAQFEYSRQTQYPWLSGSSINTNTNAFLPTMGSVYQYQAQPPPVLCEFDMIPHLPITPVDFPQMTEPTTDGWSWPQYVPSYEQEHERPRFKNPEWHPHTNELTSQSVPLVIRGSNENSSTDPDEIRMRTTSLPNRIAEGGWQKMASSVRIDEDEQISPLTTPPPSDFNRRLS